MTAAAVNGHPATARAAGTILSEVQHKAKGGDAMAAAAVEIDAMVDEKDPGERLARIETIVDQVKKDVDSIRATLRWIGVSLGGAVLVAFANFVVNGGLAPG